MNYTTNDTPMTIESNFFRHRNEIVVYEQIKDTNDNRQLHFALGAWNVAHCVGKNEQDDTSVAKANDCADTKDDGNFQNKLEKERRVACALYGQQ